jgi:hypothetical protein
MLMSSEEQSAAVNQTDLALCKSRQEGNPPTLIPGHGAMRNPSGDGVVGQRCTGASGTWQIMFDAAYRIMYLCAYQILSQ